MTTATHIPVNDIHLFRESFARVSDAYGLEMPYGPDAKREPLTDELLRDHVDGKVRIGAYTIDREGLADQIVIDHDIQKEKVNDPKEWERVRAEAKRVLSAFDEHGIEAFITSSKSRGYHVRTLWEPSPAATLRKVGEYIVRRAGIVAEVFPKQDRRGDPDPATGLPKLGYFVWLPLHGESLKDGKTAILDDGNGLDPMPDQWEALRGIRRNSHETLASVQAVVEEQEKISGPTVPAVKEVRDKIPEMYRRDTLTSIAGTLRRRGLEEKEILPTLLEVNRNRCDPPVNEKDVAAIARSIMRYPPEGVVIDMKTRSAAANTVPANTEPAIKPAVPTGPKAPLFVPVATLLDNPRAPHWFVRGYIETPSTVRIFGASGTGKSFVVGDLALASATSGRWMGKRVTGGPVYYIAGEGHTGLQRRFWAWQLHHGLDRLPENLYLSTARIELNVVGSLEVETEVERISKETETTPAMIVIDTLARAMPAGKDENSTRDMGEFINEVDKIRDKLQCVAVIIHHTGNSETHRARGSSSMLAAVDAEMHVFMQGTARIAKWVKLKDQPLDPNGYEFALRRVELGEDETAEEGEEKIITSCVVEWTREAAAHASVATNPTEAHGLKTLRAAIAATEGYSATMAAWREAFCENYWAEGAGARKTAFSRAKGGLVTKGLVRVDGDYCSISRGEKEGRP